jgi:hypothetical protein
MLGVKRKHTVIIDASILPRSRTTVDEGLLEEIVLQLLLLLLLSEALGRLIDSLLDTLISALS